MFCLGLLRIIRDSLDYILSRNDHGENRFYTENRKKIVIFVALVTLLILNAFSSSHLLKLLTSFSTST